MSNPHFSDEARQKLADQQDLTDLGRLPERIRNIARFWGGTAQGSKALFVLAQTDGLTRDVAKLRMEIVKVHDPEIRQELLQWLESRAS